MIFLNHPSMRITWMNAVTAIKSIRRIRLSPNIAEDVTILVSISTAIRVMNDEAYKKS